MEQQVAVVEQNAVTLQSRVLFKQDPQDPLEVLRILQSFSIKGIVQLSKDFRIKPVHQGAPQFTKADGGWVLAIRVEFSSLDGKGVVNGLDVGMARLVEALKKSSGVEVQDERKTKYKAVLKPAEEAEGQDDSLDMDMYRGNVAPRWELVKP